MSSNKLLRVTQMNAIYLDEEIYNSFQQILQGLIKILPPHLVAPYESEINLFLRLAILNYSIVKSGATFGQQLLAIKYENISHWQKILYIAPHCFMYLKTKLETMVPSNDINDTVASIHVLSQILDFINLSVFLRRGEKPLLIERVLGLNQVYATENAQRQFDSKYLARELLWNGFIELMLHVLPLINYHKIKRTIRNFNILYKKKPTSVVGSRNMTMHTKCAYCGQNPILPHHMGCAHVFCYVCLKGNQVADSKFECPTCGHRNPNILCDRVAVM